MAKIKVTPIELKWIVAALNHNIADIKEEMDAADEYSPVYALGELAVENRKALVMKMTDAINTGAKTISIV